MPRILTLAIFVLLAGAMLPASSKTNWPPVVDMPYPNLKLVNQDGRMTELASFKGKVILVEPIGMTCAGCNAFADSNGVGPFKGASQQQGLPSMKKLISDYGRVQLPNQDLVVIQLLLYDMKMQPPSLKDAKAWAGHFGLSTYANEYVLVGKKEHQVYELVPGFQLIDREFRLVSDATGHKPKNDMYRHLFPYLGRLLNRS